MKAHKTLVSMSVAALLSACGGSSNDSIDTPVVVAPAPVETTISGQAIKGLLANAVVTVFKYVDGEPVALTSEELKDSGIKTDAQGGYTFTVLDYTGPIKIELSVDSEAPTTMVCDAPSGCGSAEFGETVDLTALDPNFTLSSVANVTSGEETQINVSALTHLATILVEQQESISADVVSEQNAIIANTFGIQGSLATQTPTSIEDSAQVAAEDNANELRYGLINAGIAQALFAGESSAENVMSEKFAALANDLMEGNGQLLNSQDADDDFELAISDVLSGAQSAANTVAQNVADNAELTDTQELLTSLSQLDVKLANEQQNNILLAGNGGRVAVGADTVTQGDAVAKAKAMVDDVRVLANLFDLQSDENAAVTTLGEEYLTLLDDAGQMIEAQADDFELLSQVAHAVTQLSITLEDESETQTVFVISELIDAEGVTGNITYDEANYLFAIDASSADGQVVSLNASVVLDETGTKVTLAIDGALDNTQASFSITQGSQIVLELAESAESLDYLQGRDVDVMPIAGELALDVTLAQKASDSVTDPVTFSGQVSARLLPLEIARLSEDYDHQVYNGNLYIPQSEVVALPEMISLAGSFSSLSGNEVRASLTVDVANADGYQAPEFTYIGREIDDVYGIQVSEDGLTLKTIVPEETGHLGYTSISVFEPLSFSEGAYKQTLTYAADVPSEDFFGNGYEAVIVSSGGFNGNPSESFFITKAYKYEDGGFYITSQTVEPVFNDDDSVGGFEVYWLQLSSNSQEDIEIDRDNMFNEQGEIIDTQGNVVSRTTYSVGFYYSFEELTQVSWLYPDLMYEANNAAELFVVAREDYPSPYEFFLPDLGNAAVLWTEENIAQITPGADVSFSGILYQARIEDALNIDVSEDANTVTATLAEQLMTTIHYVEDDAGNHEVSILSTDENGEVFKQYISVEKTARNLDKPLLLVNMQATFYQQDSQAQRLILIPGDSNGDGIADGYAVNVFYGEYFDSEGNLINYGSGEIVESPSSNYYLSANEQWDSFFDEITIGYDPLTVSNALDVFSGLMEYKDGVSFSELQYSFDSYTVAEQGIYNIRLNAEELSTLAAGASTSFDVVIAEPDSKTKLEDDETYFDVNAALSVGVTLGDYVLDLTLQGQRSAREEGQFSLDVQYQIPDEDTQRSFTVNANTEQEDAYVVRNNENVTLVLSNVQAQADAEGEASLGQIIVGSNAEVAAEIVDRDGVIMVLYADETVESL
ncbi:hypothetical protein FX988_02086 [Paraglaciecola mesophila]|uniref:Uncharacterized protein n=1 Tax=Paraglaciecola mesophila TaxID=197222 RepID=A0A857JL53_9ALTE|nr:hypothetical protein [Paraglaciecola mesophila]QHJ11850.1 hypothetical protein FX988_02086 [Paraglaciecola mesophila]